MYASTYSAPVAVRGELIESSFVQLLGVSKLQVPWIVVQALLITTQLRSLNLQLDNNYNLQDFSYPRHQ